MKFVPVPIIGGPTDKQRVLFSVWETRAQDYQFFVTDTNRKWRKPPQPPHPKFKLDQSPTEAAVFVSWIDGQDFSAWLTARDRKSGIISTDLAYRLPTDHEWSCAAGLGGKEDPAKLPKDKVDKFLDKYPWGAGWPPPASTGNFADQTAKSEGAYAHPVTLPKYFESYDDGHAFIAPVGSFLPNEHGLYDLAGNVSEICQDWYNAERTNRVLRGASWSDDSAHTLASSWRNNIPEPGFSATVGFRLVLVPATTVV
jgi:formylglycine-generating enzyme required for sulfatase activity